MKLDKLEINGFKSFKNKTVMEFPDSFTAIIGPNGSGKSNIIDSICFVLGKSRGLRANTLTDLIYNGGVGGRKADSARVNMFLKNGHGEKTKFTREIKADGRSIYKINDKRSTRQEILEMVGDSEYNIVLQDDVTKLIDMRPVERRGIIDDLCGIREYDEKKEKALRELEKVEDRISDAYLVLGEKETYLEQLGDERDEALRYQSLQKELGDLKASLIYREMIRHQNRVQSLELELENLIRERDEKRAGLAEIRSKTNTLNSKLKDIKVEIQRVEKEKGGAGLQRKREKLIRLENQFENSSNEKKKLEKDINKSSLKKKILEEEIEEIDSELGSISGKLEKLESIIKEEGEKAGNRKLEGEIDGLKTGIFELHSQIELNVDRRGEDDRKLRELEERKKGIGSEIKESLVSEKKLSEAVKERIKENKSNFEEYDLLRGDIPLLERKRERLLNELNLIRVKAAKRKTEIKTLESSSGGLRGAVSAVMNLGGVVDGIHGTVSQLGGLTNKDYELALQVAAGAGMQYMVVANDKVATDCIQYLRKKKIGRLTFLPLNKIKSRTCGKAPKGSLGFARDFIDTKKKYRPAFNYIFRDTLLVKDLDAARLLGVGKHRMVTLDGDLLLPSGSMTGGFLKRDRFVKMSFSNTEELEKEVKVAERQIIELDGEQQKLSLEKQKMGERLSLLETSVGEARTNVEKIKLEEGNLLARRGELKEELVGVDSRISELKKSQKARDKEIKSSRKEILKQETRLEKLLGKRSEKSLERLDKLRDDYRNLDVDAGRLDEKRSLLLNQISELNTLIKSMESDAFRLDSQVSEVKQFLNSLKGELYKLESENRALVEALSRLMDERSALEDAIASSSEGVSLLEESLDELNDGLNSSSVNKARLETKLSDLVKEFADYRNFEPVDSTLKYMESRLVEVEGELESFGSVNLKSIESYDVLRDGIDETRGKVEVLKGERESIFGFMEGVEKKKMAVFMETFEVVNDNFARIYNELSGGGGNLSLDNPRDISESGLLINASSLGKKLVDVDAMSGGEKVLTCSAFMLAIQQFKPSHFYIVDELDAALDVENSLRLAKMLRDSGSQFVMITHNDSLMKHAESVIGVTLSEGVSEIVGVKLSQT
ncbi:MAG: chromosome segregation SMC family protein [Candidatus Altiarchaeota archaeon]|nr:chromosome segregation SMC family protein [Candidatus Altiarchaeota archaeon]